MGLGWDRERKRKPGLIHQLQCTGKMGNRMLV